MNAPTLPQIPFITSVTDLRYKARQIMDAVTKKGETVLVTKGNDPIAVLLPTRLYEAIRQYLEDSKDVADLKKALSQKEPSSDFIEFDKAKRKRINLPSYVPNTASQ